MAFDWDDARVFLAIHRSGSLTGAAKQIGADSSTVGRRLAAFERALGTKLFVRSRDGFHATAAGERLAARAQSMEAEAIAIDREVAGAAATIGGMVRITAPSMFGAVIVVPLLAALQRKHPDLELQVVANDNLLSLSKREADMAIRVNRSEDAGLVMRRLADFGSGVYASRGYIERMGMPPPDFEGHLVIGSDENTRDVRWFASITKRARVVWRSNTTLVDLEAVRAGIAIAMLPAYLAAGERDLVELRPPSESLMQSLWLVVHEDLQHSARVRACADFLAEALIEREPLLRGDRKRPMK